MFRDGFTIDGWSPERIEATVRRSRILGLLESSDGTINGYALYSVPTARLHSRSLMWEESICVRKSMQGNGYAGAALTEALAELHACDIGWVAGRTQNPIVMHRYSTLGTIYPFEVPYNSPRGRAVADFLQANINGVATARFERQSGICRSVYRERILGDYPWNPQGHFESQLTSHGFHREKGDAVAIVAELRTAQPQPARTVDYHANPASAPSL
ncbi:GNAT family N-acetyltransferase [Nocardia sp. NPDC050697]|uniref:GNAT family N-acetyltransferase n=1 Tax=Nocardia sp. NPDC050697 TaxID=3155158 RepID=UPI0033E300A5